MGTLISSLNIALQSMQSEQEALSTTTNNIANANTPGYTRQTVSFEESSPVEYGGLLLGNGVQVGQITSQRDSLLQTRLDQETQQQSKYGSYLDTMQQVQTLFNETTGNGLQGSLTDFFNSLQQLSTSPSSTSLRQGVLTAAQNLAQSFNNSASNLEQLQQNADTTVTETVNQINTLTAQVAKLNVQISTATASKQNAGTFIDQRDQLIKQLSGLIDVSTTDAGNGSVTLTTSNGAALVVGNQGVSACRRRPIRPLDFSTSISQGADITSGLTGGALAGALQVRDQTIPSILSSLDSLASGIGKFRQFNKPSWHGSERRSRAEHSLIFRHRVQPDLRLRHQRRNHQSRADRRQPEWDDRRQFERKCHAGSAKSADCEWPAAAQRLFQSDLSDRQRCLDGSIGVHVIPGNDSATAKPDWQRFRRRYQRRIGQSRSI